MTLNEYAAGKRLALFEDLRKGLEPREGSYSLQDLREARTKGMPQMGATQYSPDEISFEFVYPDPLGTALIFVVRIDPPERIVYLPVPSWVVENIWQGEITGAYHFEGHALDLTRAFEAELSPLANLKWFERQPAKRRE